MNKSVDIIIPIYNAYDDLIICLDSIYKYTNLKVNRLILINDNSPSPQIKPFLDEQKQYENVFVIHNATNRGFSANINIGIEQSDVNDVILLNSDTVVTKNWIEKLIKCAYSDSSIGTVTPVSNNATLCSVPKFCEENELPPELSIDEAAEIVEQCSFNQYPSITVAHGFCMYVKREVIDAIGNFDAQTFGRGYGEENDFCNRAEQAGYKHVMCDNTYIYHSGTKSFISKEKEEYIRQHDKILNQRYPKQMHNNAVHCRDNPNKKIGENINIYFDLYNHKKNLLFLVQSDFRDDASDNIGGTQLHVFDLVSSLKETYNVFVVAKDGEDLVVTSYIEEKRKSFAFKMPPSRDYPLISDSNIYNFWKNILIAFKIDIIHIHHVFGISFDVFDVAKTLDIPIILTLHDFYYICPTIKLLDTQNHVCIDNASCKKCSNCLAKQMGYVPSIEYINLWQKRCANYLRGVQQIIVPSQSAKDIYVKFYPEISQKIMVIEHGYRQLLLSNELKERCQKSNKVKAYFERIEMHGGHYCAVGWAYEEGGSCLVNQTWLRIIDEKGNECIIPTSPQCRPDVSTDANVMNCGFMGYIPAKMCTGKKLEFEIIIQTPNESLTQPGIRYTEQIPKAMHRSKLNVAFIGGLNVAKGGINALQIIKSNLKNISWFVFGGIGVSELANLEKDNLVKTGYYKPTQLPLLLKAHEIDVICILSLWPETYSYTLTEAVLNGIPVIVTNVGALGERTTKNNYGWTVNLNNINNEVIDLIKKIANDRTLLEEKKSCLKSIQIKSCIEMTNEYIPLYEKNIKDNFRDNFKFDPEYIYQGYLNANYSYTDNFSNSFSGYNAEIDAIKGELNLLKSSLTYNLLMKITSINFPFKIHLKRILLRIFK